MLCIGVQCGVVKKSHTAFTLIEILVVLAVIGILAAILFPVFGRARESARRVTCISNVKQIALAVTQYAADNSDHLPPVAYRTPGGEDVEWPELLEPYLKTQQVLRCPSDSLSVRISYGLNERAFADLEDNTPQSNQVSMFQRASETVMAAETGTADDLVTPRPDTFKLVAPAPAGDINDDEDSRPSARHFETCTVAFLDGHIKPLKLERFYLNQTPPDKFFAP
jgi:prepilin-type N-terminal cleavage/methylation domain-containing protein